MSERHHDVQNWCGRQCWNESQAGSMMLWTSRYRDMDTHELSTTRMTDDMMDTIADATRIR